MEGPIKPGERHNNVMGTKESASVAVAPLCAAGPQLKISRPHLIGGFFGLTVQGTKTSQVTANRLDDGWSIPVRSVFLELFFHQSGMKS
jgi:hypothetical protein